LRATCLDQGDAYDIRSNVPSVTHHQANQLSREQIASISHLIALSFPDPARTLHDRIAKCERVCSDRSLEVFAIWEGGGVLAHAAVFPREIATEDGPFRVQALAAVCTHPGHRGEGWGRAVVAAAFAQVDAGLYPLSLFQTGVPAFYAKLGARTVHNPFVDSRYEPPAEGDRARHGTRDAPWWNPHVMIYPAAFAWPEGTIDLLGPGY